MRCNLFQMRWNLNQWASTHVENLLKRNIWQVTPSLSWGMHFLHVRYLLRAITAEFTNTVQPSSRSMCGVNFSTTWYCLWPLHPRQLLTAVMISLNRLLDPTTPSFTPSRSMCAGDSRRACGDPCIYTTSRYMLCDHRTFMSPELCSKVSSTAGKPRHIHLRQSRPHQPRACFLYRLQFGLTLSPMASPQEFHLDPPFLTGKILSANLYNSSIYNTSS